MGYDDGDLLGIGLLTEAFIDREHLIADLDVAEEMAKQEMPYLESEVISDSKTRFKLKVLNIQHYYVNPK